MTKNIKTIITLIAVLLIGIAGGWTITYTLTPPETKTETKIETEIVDTNAEVVEAEEQVPALVEVEEGVIEEQDLKTVEEVDGGEIPENVRADGPEAAQGFAIDISSPWTVIKALNGQCVYLNNPHGSQCYNTSAVIMENQVGRWPDTCGTGAAKGIAYCWQKNAGSEYEWIADPTQLRPGDIGVDDGGVWGHTYMVAGYFNNGYIPAFSTNQGGTACSLGGSAANTINLSTAHFVGALRWHGWDYLFEEPEPVYISDEDANGTVSYAYVPGDYFSGVIVRLGLATEHGLWGPDGDVAFYNQQLLAQGLVMEEDGRIYGNIPVGSEIRLEHR